MDDNTRWSAFDVTEWHVPLQWPQFRIPRRRGKGSGDSPDASPDHRLRFEFSEHKALFNLRHTVLAASLWLNTLLLVRALRDEIMTAIMALERAHNKTSDYTLTAPGDWIYFSSGEGHNPGEPAISNLCSALQPVQPLRSKLGTHVCILSKHASRS